MEHVVLKGKGDIHEISQLLMNQMPIVTTKDFQKIHRKIDLSEFMLLVFEKHYMRNNSRSTLTVVIHQVADELIIDAIGSGGASGMFFNISLGANFDIVNTVVKVLEPKGFQVQPKEGD